MRSKKFFNLSIKFFLGSWIICSFFILAFIGIGLLSVITHRPELSAYLWLLLFCIGFFVLVFIPIAALFLIISLVLYGRAIGKSQFVIELTDCFLKTKKTILKLKQKPIKLFWVVLFLTSLGLSSIAIIYLFLDDVLHVF